MTGFKFSPQKHNFGEAFVRVIYEDGKVIEPLSKHYDGLDRNSPIKNASVCDQNGNPIYTLPIKNNKLIYRLRNLAKGLVPNTGISFSNPKRCFILATQGKIAFVWDSEQIVELDDWRDEEPYTCPIPLRDDEK